MAKVYEDGTSRAGKIARLWASNPDAYRLTGAESRRLLAAIVRIERGDD